MSQKLYYDPKKYAVSKDTPARWSQVTPTLGFKEFEKQYLTDEDCEALIAANSAHIKRITSPEN